MNNIPVIQNSQSQLEKLAAQRQLYSKAEQILTAHMFLAIPSVVAFTLLVSLIPNLRAYAALWAILITFLDILLFTPWQQSLKRQAAKIQESFDCNVLQMNWSEVTVGKRPDPELVEEYAVKYRSTEPDYSSLRDWYPKDVGRLPLQLARLLCQRTNCWWDANLRHRYATGLIASIIVLIIVVTLASLYGGLTLEKFVLVVMIPLLPALVLSVRQYKEQKESAATVNRLKDHVERLWNQALAGSLIDEEFTHSSRELQNAIYEHRRKSPLVFNWIYNRLRSTHEEQANKGAAELIKEATK